MRHTWAGDGRQPGRWAHTLAVARRVRWPERMRRIVLSAVKPLTAKKLAVSVHLLAKRVKLIANVVIYLLAAWNSACRAAWL